MIYERIAYMWMWLMIWSCACCCSQHTPSLPTSVAPSLVPSGSPSTMAPSPVNFMYLPSSFSFLRIVVFWLHLCLQAPAYFVTVLSLFVCPLTLPSLFIFFSKLTPKHVNPACFANLALYSIISSYLVSFDSRPLGVNIMSIFNRHFQSLKNDK